MKSKSVARIFTAAVSFNQEGEGERKRDLVECFIRRYYFSSHTLVWTTFED